jgi:hypothetical protein
MKSGAVLWLSRYGHGVTTLAKTLRQETGGTCGVDAADQDDAAFAAEDDGLLPFRNFGSMWQGDI